MLPDFERILLRAGDDLLEIVDARRASPTDHAFRLLDRDRTTLGALGPGVAAEITAASGERFGWQIDRQDLEALEGRLGRGEILITWRRLAPTPSTWGSAGEPAEPGRPSPGQGSEAPGQERSFYEVVVLDELETPIVGLRMTLVTPAGTVTRPTDGAGRVRVEEAPPGVGRAYVTSAAELAEILAGRERRPRRTAPLPEAAGWHARIASAVGDSVTLPDGEPQRLLIVSRTDLRHFNNRNPWTELSLVGEAPCLLDGGEHPSVALCSDARGAEAVVVGAPPTPEGAPVPEGAPAPEWLRAGIDALHAALFRGDLGPVWALLESIPLEPPAVPSEAAPPVVETIAFQAAIAELLLEGRVDPLDGEGSAL